MVSTYNLFRDFTMIPEQTFIDNLNLVWKFMDVEGCVVECGTWKGGMIAGIAELMGDSRQYHLFDSFEGLPQATEKDGIEAIKWQKDVDSPAYYDNCKTSMRFAIQAMKLSKVNPNNYKIYKGWFHDMLPVFNHVNKDKIAILRLDSDWYDSTMDCLNNLYSRVADGGVIIIDDYYAWDGCTRAVHDFLSKNNIPDRIMQWQNSICYIVKSKVGLMSIE